MGELPQRLKFLFIYLFNFIYLFFFCRLSSRKHECAEMFWGLSATFDKRAENQRCWDFVGPRIQSGSALWTYSVSKFPKIPLFWLFFLTRTAFSRLFLNFRCFFSWQIQLEELFSPKKWSKTAFEQKKFLPGKLNMAFKFCLEPSKRKGITWSASEILNSSPVKLRFLWISKNYYIGF